ncbi:hypothetical protein CJZ01_03925 [Campylobacter coli]|nr:hypothetical protein [Campylobacter coli]EAI8196295.1 hypothetical protein [Campylobacter coli]EAI8203529.1 hypothetical protein [Campylobacter coli]EAK4634315.1 hypothetical protein [Campylobacter coli]
MQENLKEIYKEFEFLNTQFSSYFNDEEFVNFKKDFEAKNALNYRDFEEFKLEETDKERLKDIQIRKILKEKDELAEEKSLWISKVLPF